jgi:hypothetical protein
MNLLKILTPLSLLFLAYLNNTYQNEVIVSAKEYKDFENKHAEISKIVALQQSKYFDYRKSTKGVQLPKGDKKTIYLTKDDYINLQK